MKIAALFITLCLFGCSRAPGPVTGSAGPADPGDPAAPARETIPAASSGADQSAPHPTVPEANHVGSTMLRTKKPYELDPKVASEWQNGPSTALIQHERKLAVRKAQTHKASPAGSGDFPLYDDRENVRVNTFMNR